MSLYSNKKQIPKQLRPFAMNLAQDFAVVETILRNRTQFFQEIRDGVKLREKIEGMTLSTVIFLAIYGAVLGSTHSLLMAFSSAVKLPVLFLSSMLICIPSLYIFSLLFGSNQRLKQTFTLVLSALTTTSVLLLSFASITFFFLITTSGYQFFKILNVSIFAISGLIGMVFLTQGAKILAASDETEGNNKRNFILYLWILLYGFVGSQMAWTLRPFIGHPNAKFELVREVGGNFYSNILASIGELLGFVMVF